MVFGKTIPGRVNWLFIFQKEKKYYSDRAAAAAFNSRARPTEREDATAVQHVRQGDGNV
jgi:hypothetical protein